MLVEIPCLNLINIKVPYKLINYNHTCNSKPLSETLFFAKGKDWVSLSNKTDRLSMLIITFKYQSHFDEPPLLLFCLVLLKCLSRLSIYLYQFSYYLEQSHCLFKLAWGLGSDITSNKIVQVLSLSYLLVAIALRIFSWCSMLRRSVLAFWFSFFDFCFVVKV